MSKRHQLKEYIKYQRKASTRHAVHSPFVYEFIEKFLRKKTTPATNLVLVTSKHKRFVNKLIGYFQRRHILWLTNNDGETETFITIEAKTDKQIKLKSERFDFDHFNKYPAPDLYLIDLNNPEDWLQAWEKYKPKIQPDDIVLITSVHHSKEHTAAWEKIFNDETIKLSMDLYQIGLLFFREAFKEKQHFILKH